MTATTTQYQKLFQMANLQIERLKKTFKEVCPEYWRSLSMRFTICTLAVSRIEILSLKTFFWTKQTTSSWPILDLQSHLKTSTYQHVSVLLPIWLPNSSSESCMANQSTYGRLEWLYTNYSLEHCHSKISTLKSSSSNPFWSPLQFRNYYLPQWSNWSKLVWLKILRKDQQHRIYCKCNFSKHKLMSSR